LNQSRSFHSFPGNSHGLFPIEKVGRYQLGDTTLAQV
jgi:hypothetical protein